MMISIERGIDKKLGYIYKIRNEISEDVFFARSNLNKIYNLRSLALYDLKQYEICSMKQVDVMRKAISLIPIVNLLIPSCPFEYFENGNVCGKAETKVGKAFYYITVNAKVYTMKLHTGNKISIFKDEIQIGLITKSYITRFVNNRYEVLVDKSIGEKLASLFCVFADVIWFSDNDYASTMSWETSYIFGDKGIDKNWKAEDGIMGIMGTDLLMQYIKGSVPIN